MAVFLSENLADILNYGTGRHRASRKGIALHLHPSCGKIRACAIINRRGSDKIRGQPNLTEAMHQWSAPLLLVYSPAAPVRFRHRSSRAAAAADFAYVTASMISVLPQPNNANSAGAICSVSTLLLTSWVRFRQTAVGGRFLGNGVRKPLPSVHSAVQQTIVDTGEGVDFDAAHGLFGEEMVRRWQQ